jgi:hypothetical protein
MFGTLLAIAPKQAILWGTLGLLGFVGLIAIVSTARFAKLARGGGRWIDINKFVAILDKRVDIDHYVLPFSRLLGVAVILSVGVLVFVLLKYE